MENTQALSIAQAAKLLGVGRSTFYEIVKSGHIPVRKLGRRSLVLRSDVDTYLTGLPTLPTKTKGA